MNCSISKSVIAPIRVEFLGDTKTWFYELQADGRMVISIFSSSVPIIYGMRKFLSVVLSYTASTRFPLGFELNVEGFVQIPEVDYCFQDLSKNFLHHKREIMKF